LRNDWLNLSSSMAVLHCAECLTGPLPRPAREAHAVLHRKPVGRGEPGDYAPPVA
jgi:hypothetical protein